MRIGGKILMAININSGNENVIEAKVVDVAEPTTGTSVISLEKTNEIRAQQEAMLSVRTKVKERLIQSGKMDLLTAQIDINDSTSIIEFGKEPAEYAASIADRILTQYDSKNIDGTAKLVEALVNLMKRIDIDEIESK